MDPTEFEEIITNAVLKTPAPGKHCARSSLRHIRKAQKLSCIDPEMSIFRAITGEEESASAIFHALQRRHYANARKLKPRDHVQKNAVVPFFDAINVFLAKNKILDKLPDLQIIYAKSQKQFKVRYKSFHPTTNKESYVFPDPPLGFTINVNRRKHDFREEFQDIANLKNSPTILKHLRNRANKRNILLYAQSKGIPSITSPVSSHLELYKNNILRNLLVFLLIDQYPDKQLFAQQALTSFLVMIEKLSPNIVFE